MSSLLFVFIQKKQTQEADNIKGEKVNKVFGYELVKLFKINKNNVYSLEDYKHKINQSMIHNTYLETTNMNQNFPNSDSVHRLIHDLSIENIRKQIQEKSYKILKKLKQRYILIFDSTHEPFYGSKKGMYINEYKKQFKGATGSFKYLTCFLLTENQKFFIDSIPLSSFNNENKEVLNILDNISGITKRKPDVILFDKTGKKIKILDVCSKKT